MDEESDLQGNVQDIDSKDENKMWLGGVSTCFANLVSVFAGPELPKEPEEQAWEVPSEEIHDLKFLGSGAQGIVYTGCWRGEMIAIKKVRENYETSAQHLRRLNHPNIIRFLGICYEPPLYGLIMEFAQYGSLFQFLHSGSNLLPSQLMKWAKDVAVGMLYLNDNKIIHRDLKSPNVLISDNYVAKVSDFGTSREWKDVSTVMTFMGTIAWMAPEVIRNQLCSDRVDVWSYGVFLWEIVTREVPYRTLEPHTILWGVGGDTLSLPIPSGCPKSLQVLISQCWQKIPRNRPSFKIIVASLELVTQEFEAIDSTTFAADQASWGAEARDALKNLYKNREAASSESDDLVEDNQTLRENLRQAREMYLTHVNRANDMFMDVCAFQLVLEQRERDLAEREKLLQSCRCGRKPKKMRRQESSTSSDGKAIAKQPRKRPVYTDSQVLVKYIDNNEGKTHTVAVDSCPCITQNVYNNNLINDAAKEIAVNEAAGEEIAVNEAAGQETVVSDVKETVVEENGNVGIQSTSVVRTNVFDLDNIPEVAEV